MHVCHVIRGSVYSRESTDVGRGTTVNIGHLTHNSNNNSAKNRLHRIRTFTEGGTEFNSLIFHVEDKAN